MTQVTSSPEARLVVVDDEPNIRDLLAASLRFAGFDVITAATGHEGIATIVESKPDLAVLDVMLPDVDGFAVTRQLRHRGVQTPVVFLTAKDAPSDTVAGLTVGGDDYVTKPFSLEELIARIRAVLRRTGAGEAEHSVLRYDDLEIDEDSHDVRRAGESIELSPTEFKLLRYLMLNAGRVLSKSQILDHVWEYDWRGETAIVETYISYLRRKLDVTSPEGHALPTLIQTRRGVGYMLKKS